MFLTCKPSIRFALTLYVVSVGVVLWCSAQNGSRRIESQVTPIRSGLARKFNIEGTVRLEVRVAKDGTVKTIRATGGNPVLIESAVDCVRQWKYVPAHNETVAMVEIVFGPGS